MSRLGPVRWLLLGIFLVPLFDTTSPLLEMDGTTIIGLSLVSLLACALLLTRLNRPWSKTLWIWAVLLVFLVGCYWQTFWFGRDLEQLQWFVSEGYRISLSDIAEGYRWITLAFVTFCLTTWVVLGLSSPRNAHRVPNPPYPARHKSGKSIEAIPDGSSLVGGISSHAQLAPFGGDGRVLIGRVLLLLFTTTGLSLALSGLRAVLSLRIMGAEVLGEAPSVTLPFYLDTMILRLQSDLIPAVLIMCIWMMERQRRQWWALLAVGLLFMHYAILTVVIGSRGGLVLFGLNLLLLWLLTERLTRRRLGLIVTMGVITIVVVYPLMTYLRYYRTTQAEGLVSGLGLAFDEVSGFGWFTQSLHIAQRLVYRVTGAEGVWFSLRDIGTYPLEATLDFRSVHHPSISIYYTQTVLRSANPTETAAPGLIGAGMLLGGMPGVVSLWAGFVLFANSLWGWFSRFRTAPVSLTVGAYYLWAFAQGGMLDYRDFIGLLITVLMCEGLYRAVLASRILPTRSISVAR